MFFRIITDNTSLALEKRKKMQYSLIILVQGFCPLKIKITQFPGGFRLNILCFSSRKGPKGAQLLTGVQFFTHFALIRLLYHFFTFSTLRKINVTFFKINIYLGASDFNELV